MIDNLGPGGAEKLTVQILERINKNLFDIRVCVLQERQGNPFETDIKKSGIKVDFLDISRLRNLFNLPKIIRYLHSIRPNIIHTQLQFSDILGIMAGKILGIPCVSTQHTMDESTENLLASIRKKATWFCLRYFCDLVITVSEETRKFHLKFGKLNPKKTITIYNGINIQDFLEIPFASREETRKALGIPLNTYLVTTVAVLREQKGIQYMIAAIPEIIVKIPNFSYMIVGNGVYRTKIEEIINELDVRSYIYLIGHREDVPQLLNASDVFVLPTLGDALPTVLFEAMASRIPIVSTSVGGVPEIISNNKNGILVAPKNSHALSNEIVRLHENPLLSKNLCTEGYGTVQRKFNIHSQVDALQNLYLEVIIDS